MSGFMVAVGPKGQAEPVADLSFLERCLGHVGPDRHGSKVIGNALMYHALRVISDEERAEQPASLDGNGWLVSDARLDASEELVSRLGLGSPSAPGNRSAEKLILEAYRAWGDKLPDHLEGDYSFAVWDAQKRTLLCARDKFGVKQLYYGFAGATFVVSSHLRAILGYPGISRELDEQAIGDFLLFGDHHWMDKSKTAFRAVAALPPAHALVFEAGRVRVRRFWDFPLDVPLLRYRKEQEYLEHFVEVFRRALIDRLSAPRVSVLMGGGSDSTAVAAVAARLRSEGAVKLDRICAVTADYDRVHPCGDKAIAESVARRLGIGFRYVAGEPFPLLEPGVATVRPLQECNPAFSLEVLRTASEEAPVVLTGMAADNLLSPSPLVQTCRGVNPLRVGLDLVRMYRAYGSLPYLGTGVRARLLRVMGRGEGAGRSSAYPYPGWLEPGFEERADLIRRWEAYWTGSPGPLNHRHPGAHEALLTPNWNTSDVFLAPGFTLAEERDPFLDFRMLGFLLAVPSFPWFFRKHLLRRSMAPLLPAEVTQRSKRPAGFIHRSLLRQPENRWVDSWVASPALQAFVDRDKVPPLFGGGADPAESFVNLRPVMLNTWLSATLSEIRA